MKKSWNGLAQKRVSRRSVIKAFGLGSTVLYLKSAGFMQFLQVPGAFAGDASIGFDAMSPINRSLGEIAVREFFGDDMERAHRLIWRQAADAASSLDVGPIEEVPLVVVGGGLGGLFTTYLLRDQNPVLLEQALRFGGVSQGQAWRNMDYGIGGAYFMGTEPDDPLHALYEELGLPKMYKVKESEDAIVIQGKLTNDFWSNSSETQSEQRKNLAAHFRNIFNEEEGLKFPEIPYTDSDMQRYVLSLDKKNFKTYLQEIVGGKLEPEIETVIEFYCWSAFGASASEISAACGLNFYASEFGSVYVMPGGNGGLAEQILKKIWSAVPKTNIRPGAAVTGVKTDETGVTVHYIMDGKNRALRAKAAVLCCPKFVVGRILQDLEVERKQAIAKLNYRAYLVGNVLLNGTPNTEFYDAYLLKNGHLPEGDMETASRKVGTTDVIYGNYVHPDAHRTILTLYRPLPFDGGRMELFDSKSYDQFRGEFERQLKAEILPVLGFNESHIVDLRMARWGHAVAVASQGLMVDKTVDWLRKPFRDRVFFVEHDNWALPAVETAATEAILWKPEIEAVLKR